MGLWDKFRGLVTSEVAAPLGADEVTKWYEALSEGDRSKWSERIREARDETGRARPAGEIRCATGRLLFHADGPRGPIPLHHVRVELWDHDPGALDDFLGASVTDLEGRFSIDYDPRDAGIGDIPDLELRAMEARHTFDREGRAHDRYERVFTLRGPDNVEAAIHDFGDVRVPWWEYDPHGALPRLHVPEQGTPPEGYAPGRSLAMVQAVGAVETAKRKHLAQIALGLAPSIDAIQAGYPSSITTEQESREKGSTRGSEWFGDRMLNGFFSTVFDRDWDSPTTAGAFRVFHPWNAYEQDGDHCFPSVDIRLQLRDGALLPTRITLGMRERGATAPMSPITRVEVAPGDGARWTAALRVARVSATFEAELSNHLGQCHLNVEQYAVAARRNLRTSPLRWLLFPHLREVALINHAADDFLVGPRGYVTRAGGLSQRGLETRLLHAMGGFDWQGFRPQPPLCEGHSAAKASEVFWAMLGEHVDAFLTEHRATIATNWAEVRRMSDDLVAHAVPFYACAFVRKQIAANGAPFLQHTERPDYRLPRPVVDGVARAVSPVTERDAPEGDDWQRLAQMCCYVLFFATFRHAWANNLQWDDVGELRYASLGLRWTDAGPLADEGDDGLAPGPVEATEMLWISWLLSRASYGTLVTNEDSDVHPRLVSLVRSRRKELEALGMNVDRVASRINI